jgi:hypothetical protein
MDLTLISDEVEKKLYYDGFWRDSVVVRSDAPHVILMLLETSY